MGFHFHGWSPALPKRVCLGTVNPVYREPSLLLAPCYFQELGFHVRLSPLAPSLGLEDPRFHLQKGQCTGNLLCTATQLSVQDGTVMDILARLKWGVQSSA